MTDEAHERERSPEKKNYGYVCHCRKCSGVVAVVAATASDVPELVSGWLSMENTYVERRPIPVIRKLKFCDATSPD